MAECFILMDRTEKLVGYYGPPTRRGRLQDRERLGPSHLLKRFNSVGLALKTSSVDLRHLSGMAVHTSNGVKDLQ